MEIKMNGLSLNLISHPGDTLAELLNDYNMTQKELAVRLSCTPKHINEIIKGIKPISNALAVKLENVFPLKTSFWNNLQNIYDEQIEKLKITESITQKEIDYFKDNKSVYNFLLNEKCVEPYSDITQGILNLRKFLQINNLLDIGKLLQINGAYRISHSDAVNELALACWLRMCDIYCDKVKTDEFKELNKRIIIEDIKTIRSLSCLKPNIFINKLQEYFAKLGIAFVVLKNIRGAPVNGLIKRKNNSISICLTIRGKDADKFWFTLFHEIGHLVISKIDKIYVDYERTNDDIEKQADEFASQNLIDLDIYNKLISEDFSKSSVLEAAKQMHILPSILVGRLQHDGYIRYNQYNDLKTQYSWMQ